MNQSRGYNVLKVSSKRIIAISSQIDIIASNSLEIAAMAEEVLTILVSMVQIYSSKYMGLQTKKSTFLALFVRMMDKFDEISRAVEATGSFKLYQILTNYFNLVSKLVLVINPLSRNEIEDHLWGERIAEAEKPKETEDINRLNEEIEEMEMKEFASSLEAELEQLMNGI